MIRNELAGGVLPSGRFGANAAWLRLPVLTHSVLTALKRLGFADRAVGGGAEAAAVFDPPQSPMPRYPQGFLVFFG